MVKLVALFKKLSDTEAAEAFEKHYFDVHMPLVAKIPGLVKSEVAYCKGLPGMETKYHLMTEMYYENMDDLNAGMASPEGKAAGRDLMSFAKDYVEMMLGEVKK